MSPHVDLGLRLVFALWASEGLPVWQDLQEPVLEVFGGQVVCLVELGRLVANRTQDVLAAAEAAVSRGAQVGLTL